MSLLRRYTDTEVFWSRKNGTEHDASTVVEQSFTIISDWMHKNDPEKAEFIVLSSNAYAKRITIKDMILSFENIKAVPVVRNISVYMEYHMNFASHITLVQKSCYYDRNGIEKIRRYHTREQPKSTAHSFVAARINYKLNMLHEILISSPHTSLPSTTWWDHTKYFGYASTTSAAKDLTFNQLQPFVRN